MSSTLPGCVASLQSSLDLLSSSISTLDSGVHDFPRMTKVLQTTRHYELLPESTLANAQSSLLSTLTPELEGMLGRVESYLDRLQRREAALIARYELQAGRLASRRRPSQSADAEDDDKAAAGATSAAEDAKEAFKRRQIRAKKDRLSYAVDRLALQAQQKERQLRQSMAKGPL